MIYILFTATAVKVLRHTHIMLIRSWLRQLFLQTQRKRKLNTSLANFTFLGILAIPVLLAKLNMLLGIPVEWWERALISYGLLSSQIQVTDHYIEKKNCIYHFRYTRSLQRGLFHNPLHKSVFTKLRAMFFIYIIPHFTLPVCFINFHRLVCTHYEFFNINLDLHISNYVSRCLPAFHLF